MTDKEIDTSDIPPLDEKFFAAAKLRLPRLYIDVFDFREAQKYADFILKNDLHAKKKTKPARVRQELVHRAFYTSLLVSYSRPFKSYYGLDGKKGSAIKNVREVLRTENEFELHQKVLDLRDQSCAHSDSRSRLFARLDYFDRLPFFKVVEVLTKTETQQLRLIIGKWIKHLEGEKSEIKNLRRRLA